MMGMLKLSIGATIAIAVTGLFLTLVAAGVLTSSQTLQSAGTITSVNVGVYSDSGCTLALTSLDWGTLAPGASTTRTIYFKNTGTVPVTLSMTTTSWVPSNANTYLTVAWNRESSVLAAGSSISAILTLTASASAGSITTFSFNNVVTGTQ
jgi:hypothetical protein